MSFLQRVVSEGRSTVPGIPVARPKGLLAGALLSEVGSPIEQAEPSASGPIRHEPRPGRAPVLDAAPERPASRQPDALPAAPPAVATESAPSPAARSSRTDLAVDTPPVVTRRDPSRTTAEESSPDELPQTTPPEARHPAVDLPATDPGPSDTPDSLPSDRPVLELAEPRDDPGAPDAGLEGPVETQGFVTPALGAARTTQTATPTSDGRDGAVRGVSPQPGDGAPILEPVAPKPASRPIEKGDSGLVEVVPIAEPRISTPTPLPPAERAPPSRPAIEPTPPLLHIDQIDVVVTDPTPMPPAPASRSPFAAVSANRRYLRRL